MVWKFSRNYTGPIRAIVVDLAGTTVDYGSCAPAKAFIELFRRRGVDISTAQARGPMGMQKCDHIRALLQNPEIANAWEKRHGQAATSRDIEELYREFIPLQMETLAAHAEPIPGACEVVASWRNAGRKVAANTGYNLEMTGVVISAAAAKGLHFDAVCCAEEVSAGRPAPWMIYRCMEQLHAYPQAAVLKIGDTVVDVEEGLNAGVWSVAVAKTGNALGLSLAEVKSLAPAELERRLTSAREALACAGAHYVVDSIEDCVFVLQDIEARLRRGERP